MGASYHTSKAMKKFWAQYPQLRSPNSPVILLNIIRLNGSSGIRGEPPICVSFALNLLFEPFEARDSESYLPEVKDFAQNDK